MHDLLHTWMDDHASKAVLHLEELVAINTHSLNTAGLEASASSLATLFGELGSVTVEQTPPTTEVDGSGESLVTPLGPLVRVHHDAPGPRVMLIGHHDTVFTPDVHFGWHRSGDTITGPGVADAKGGLVQLWLALGALEAAGCSPAWDLLIVPDEEIGSPGSAPAIRAAAREAALGFGFEPSFPDGGVAGARAGSGNFAIVIRGRAAHAGREHHLGRNAVVEAAEVIGRLASLTAYPEILSNPGVVSGGRAVNIVPDTAVVRSNIRVRTPEQAEFIQASLEELVAGISAKDGFSAELHGRFGRPPKPRTPGYDRLLDAVVAAGAELGLVLAVADTGGVCDGNLMADEGLVNVDNLGPVGGGLHQVGEYLHEPSIANRALLTATLLANLEDLVRKDPST